MKKTGKTIICPHCGQPIDIAPEEDKTQRHSGVRSLVAAVIISVIVCAVGFALYMHQEQRQETEAWELAVRSNDPMTVQAYLDTYRQAPEEHRQKAAERLEQLQAEANAWRQAVAAGSIADFTAFARRFPDSQYTAQALTKADSLTYAMACRKGGESDFASYLAAYPNGIYADEARAKMQDAQSTVVSAEDEIMAEMVASRLISAISAADKEALMSMMADTLSTFLGSANTPREHTARLITQLQAPSGSSANWMEPTNIVVKKSKKVSDVKSNSSTMNVEFTAERSVQTSGETQSTKYKFIITLLQQGEINSIAVAKVKS